MKKIISFYHNRFTSIDSFKKLLSCIVIPFALTFCCTLYILTGIAVSAMGSKPHILLETPSLQEDIANEILRLHVIANSDTTADQEVKLLVKNHLVTYMQTFLEATTSKEASMEQINAHTEDIKAEAIRILRENGFNYDVEVSLGKATFPIKVYGDITLPAGEYDALRVKLGEAKGKNWWCILFPNLCYVDSTFQVVPKESKEELEAILTKEEYNSILTKKETKVTVKFKLIQWLSDLF